jgi:hypothetical protein
MSNIPVIMQSAQYQQQIMKIKKSINNIQNISELLQSDIDDCVDNLQEKSPELMEDQRLIKRQIEDENIKRIQEKNTKHDPRFQQFKKEEPPKVDINTEKSCKKLFRDISKKCHPDITNSEKLITLFKEANDAYINFEFKTLSDIWAQLKTGTIIDNLFNNPKEYSIEVLLNEIKILQEELMKKQNALKNIKTSLGFVILIKYKEGGTGEMIAKSMYANHLTRQNLMMLTELEKMQNEK